MPHNITQAVILCAGFGTRLRPLTDKVPKVMLPFAGKPLLEYHLEHLKRHGITDIFINLHHLPCVIQDYFGDGSRWGVRITYALEPEIRGTAGGVKNFEGELKDAFLVIYGDMFSTVNYTKMAAAFRKKENVIALSIVGDPDYIQHSDLVEVDGEMKMVKVYPRPHPDPPQHFKVLLAIHIFNERILPYIPAGKHYDIDGELLPHILERGEAAYGYETKEFLMDIGTPERYEIVKRWVEKRYAAPGGHGVKV